MTEKHKSKLSAYIAIILQNDSSLVHLIFFLNDLNE